MFSHFLRPMLTFALMALIASTASSEEKAQPITIKTLMEQNYSAKGIQIKFSRLGKLDVKFSAKNTTSEPILFKIQEIFIKHEKTQFYIHKSFNLYAKDFVTPLDIKIQPNMTVDFYLSFNDVIKFPCKIYICDTFVAEIIDKF